VDNGARRVSGAGELVEPEMLVEPEGLVKPGGLVEQKKVGGARRASEAGGLIGARSISETRRDNEVRKVRTARLES
jgi:hypothetical protein